MAFPGAELRLSSTRIAARIQPDDPALDEWFSSYCREHRKRLAADLYLIERHVEPGARVLEYGAIPLVMTAALTALEYEVSAVDVKPERFAKAIASLDLDVTQCDVETEAVPFAAETFDVGSVQRAVRAPPDQPDLHAQRGSPGAEARRTAAPVDSQPPVVPRIRNLVLRNQGHAVSAGVYRQYEKLETLGHMGHVREYTTREVSDFLARVGFRVDKIVYRGGHGRGVVGIAERLAPSLRPFFALVATKADPVAPKSSECEER